MTLRASTGSSLSSGPVRYCFCPVGLRTTFSELVMPIRLTALWVFMGSLVALSLRASAQVPESRTDPFVAEATEAIRSPKGAVLVARITGTGIAREGSSWVMHGIAVERVIKTFRNDKGVYFVPTIILENPKEEKSGLKRGALYVVVVKLKRAPYGYLVLTGAREIDGTAGDPVIEILVQEARQRSVFGSSPLLDTFLKTSWDHSGIHTPRADGSVDPVAFGLTTERLLRDIDADLTVAVVSYLRPKRLAGDEEVTDWLCDVVDHLGGPPSRPGKLGSSTGRRA
jgi:hypothetical protein